ncbi:MAG: sugar ABC transporter ATP-binding protein [Dehalococcoidia bacterium]|nr:sugar ABC transporter ATP-binding protein [Dehalococcoidia bacterium]
MKEKPLLEMKGIVKEFPGALALAGVDFDLYRGEVHALVGENGAGKSTLTKILSGVYPPDHGEICIDGKRESIPSPHRALQLGISTIYQEFYLVPHFSIAENIFLGREPRLTRWGLVDRDRMNRDAQGLLVRFNVDLSPTVPVGLLSPGKRQVVEIARALSMDARIVVMDEPTAALTGEETGQLFEIIVQMKSHGIGIIYISHRLEEIRQIADRVTVFRDGHTVGSLDSSSLDLDRVVQFMVGREVKVMFPKEVAPRGQEVLRVQGLTARGLFHEVSFSLHAGEVMGFAGLLGAGRTELARAIYGAEALDSGQIHLFENAVHIGSPQTAIRKGMAFLPSERMAEGLVGVRPVRENVTMSSTDRLSSLGVLRLKEEDEVANGYVRRFDIKPPDIMREVRLLSGGNQQKVVMAKSLCQQAKVIIFDEPTCGIDVGSKVEIYHYMNELAKQGAAIMVLSSDLLELKGMCDRILVMHRGRISGEFRPPYDEEGILRCCFGQTDGQASLWAQAGLGN